MIILNVFRYCFWSMNKKGILKISENWPLSAYLENVQLTTSVDLNTALNIESCLSL